MKFKSFVEPSNREEENVKLALAEAGKNAVVAKLDVSDRSVVTCVKCKSDQNVKLANIDPLSENKDQNQYPLCENCRKVSFKVKIFR